MNFFYGFLVPLRSLADAAQSSGAVKSRMLSKTEDPVMSEFRHFWDSRNRPITIDLNLGTTHQGHFIVQ